MRAWLVAIALAGCGFKATPSEMVGGDPAGGGDPEEPPIDAPGPPPVEIDGAPLDGAQVATCLGTFVRVCVDPPQSSVMLTPQANMTIDTGTSALCAPYTSEPHVDACVITGQSITLSGGTVSVSGRRPLILFSTGSITISGVLDAASHPTKDGPGADADCPSAGFTNPTDGGFQGGGGWGGSFGTAGGNGGNGASGSGGVAPGAFPATALRGGCPGSSGANGAGRGGGRRGHGGGAVALLAMQTITIDGTVNASGAAGRGSGVAFGVTGGGGGGGGSGGMIVLEAGTVTIPGKCFANGGGGGEGAGFSGGRDGGESPAPSEAGDGASGGSRTGGDGGGGAFGTTGSAGGGTGSRSRSDGDGGGGGGGGGAGVIKVVAPSQTSTSDATKIAPLPT
ncbi:MAG TPA: hypothetical protein VFT22_18330 [Kofleriaceae bacterium]|nr:hypothetical protein [Kofleriaceae bacterium]